MVCSLQVLQVAHPLHLIALRLLICAVRWSQDHNQLCVNLILVLLVIVLELVKLNEGVNVR
jgi:hypothetical protein